MIKYSVIAGLFFVVCLSARADIFSYKDENGILHIGNRPEIKKYGKLFIKEHPRRFVDNRSAEEIIQVIDRIADAEGVDKLLVRAVARAESGFQPNAVSPKGAIGVMQLMPATAERFEVKDIYHVEENIKGGIRYLKYLQGLFPDDIRLAIAAYNAGENRVLQNGTIPEITETIEYVDRVIQNYNQYQGKASAPEPTKRPNISRPVRKIKDEKGCLHLTNL